MARNQPAPLESMLDAAAITIGGQTYMHQFAKPIEKYHGQRLYASATSDGTILSVVISTTPSNDPPPTAGATYAEINVSYADPTTPERWIIPGVNYTANTPIEVGMVLDTRWAHATLLVGAPLPPKPASDSATLDYVVVHEDADAARDAFYTLYWFSTAARINPNQIASATFIPDPGGGITGPFGISTP